MEAWTPMQFATANIAGEILFCFVFYPANGTLRIKDPVTEDRIKLAYPASQTLVAPD